MTTESSLRTSSPWYIGIAVQGLDGMAAARDELSHALGVHWREPITVVNDYSRQFDGGDGKLHLCFTEEGPTYLKLIAGPDGSIWDTAAGPHLHHVGFTSPDVEADTDRLVSDGLELLWRGSEDAYLRSATGGTYVELAGSASDCVPLQTRTGVDDVTPAAQRSSPEDVRPFFVGMAVPGPDGIEAARAEFAHTFQIDWRIPKIFENDYTRQFEGGKGQLTVCFAGQGPAHMKVIAGPSGSIWDTTNGPCLHQIGFWSHNVSADVQRLVEQGLRCDRHGPYAAYLYGPRSGIYIELVDVAEGEALCSRWKLPERQIGFIRSAV